MTFYAVDSKRQSMRSTGIVNEVKDWVVGATATAAQNVSVLFQNASNPGNPQVQAILKTLPGVH